MNFRNNLCYFFLNILLAVGAVPYMERVPMSTIEKKAQFVIIVNVCTYLG